MNTKLNKKERDAMYFAEYLLQTKMPSSLLTAEQVKHLQSAHRKANIERYGKPNAFEEQNEN